MGFDFRSSYVYLAGPMFTEEEKEVCRQLEEGLSEKYVKFFSPRLDTAEAGKKLGMNTKALKDLYEQKDHGDDSLQDRIKYHLTERLKAAKDIFMSNTQAIECCKLMLANIDNRDPGTMFEIGYAVAQDIPVITYSTHNYGVNIMIGQSARLHLTSLTEVIKAAHDLMEDIAEFGHFEDSTWETYKTIDEREQI